jgi:hypothetical protein
MSYQDFLKWFSTGVQTANGIELDGQIFADKLRAYEHYIFRKFTGHRVPVTSSNLPPYSVN